MRKDLMAKTAQLEEFDEALYKVTGALGKKKKEGDWEICNCATFLC